MSERRFVLEGRNYDRNLTFTEPVWAETHAQAVQRATDARSWLGMVAAHVWVWRDPDLEEKT